MSEVKDWILNPIRHPDRFGTDIKEFGGKKRLYYGIVISTDEGKVLPSLYDGVEWRFGEDELKALGFNFSKDFTLAEETWERNRLYHHLSTPSKVKTTQELMEYFVKINKEMIWYDDEITHYIVGAYLLASYMYPAFSHFPRMVFLGLAGSGKSTQTDLMSTLALNPITSADASKSFLFRMVEQTAGLVCIDNFDNISEDAQKDMVQLFDTSFEKGRAIGRTDDSGRTKTPRKWRTYCPMVVNCTSLAWLRQQSSKTRTIFVRMLTKTGKLELRKLKTLPKDEIENFKHDCRLWALANWERISALETDGFSNREFDIFRPILTILKDAGPDKFEVGKNFLSKMAAEYQRDEPDVIDAEIVMAVWNLLCSSGKDTAITPKEIAKEILMEREVSPTDTDGRANRLYDRELADLFRNKIPVCVKSLPIEKITHPNNKTTYHFNFSKYIRFMKARNYDVGEYAKSLNNMLEGLD